MAREFEKIREENGVIYADNITFNKHGKKIIDTRVIGYKKSKQPKQPKFTGKSKKNNYTPSPTTNDYNSKRPVYKNISSQPKKDKEAFNAVITYIADLHDKKNKNEEIVELIYNDRENPQKTATTKEDKLELADKAYDDFLADFSIKRQGEREKRTISKHSMFSLPPSLKLDIPREQQAKILQETMIKTINEMEEFKDHKYLLAIHEDQVNSEGGVHCHLVMEYHNKNGHSLKMPNVTALKQRNNEFKRKMVFNLYQDYNITLDSTEKPPFTPDLHKGLTFLEITKDNRVLVVDKLGEIRELKFKGVKQKAIDLNLKLGDRFDYITEKEPKLDKDGNQIYINNKPQYKNIYSLGNVITQEQMQEQVIEEQKQIIENLPQTKLKREIKEAEKSISWLDKKFNTPYKAKTEEEIKNKELALKAIELNNNGTIENMTKTDIALMYYYNNDFIKPDEKQPQFIKDIYTIALNFPKIAQYLPDEVKESIRDIIKPYNEIHETMSKNPIIRDENHIYSKSKELKEQRLKELQKTIIEFYPDTANQSQEFKQLQEKRKREYYDTIRQYQYNSTEQSKSLENTKSNAVNKPTPTTPTKGKEDKKKNKNEGWER